MAVVEFVKELAERVFDFFWCVFEVDAVEFFEELGDGVGGAGESSMR